MSTVGTNEECPRCKQPDLYITLDCKTGEENGICCSCGYYFAHLIIYEDGKPKLVDPEIGPLLTNVEWKTEKDESPFGIFHYWGIQGFGTIMVASTEEDWNKIVDQFTNKTVKGISPSDELIGSRFDNGIIVKTTWKATPLSLPIHA